MIAFFIDERIPERSPNHFSGLVSSGSSICMTSSTASPRVIDVSARNVPFMFGRSQSYFSASPMYLLTDIESVTSENHDA